MLKFLTDEHRLIAETAHRVFSDLSKTDRQKRQLGQGRIDSADVATCLDDFGVFDGSSGGSLLGSLQVQSLIAREAGAACLPLPVLEVLANFQLAGEHGPGFHSSAPSGASSSHNAPVLRGGVVHGQAKLVPFADSVREVVLSVRCADKQELIRVRLKDSRVCLIPRGSVEADYPLFDLIFEGVATESISDAANTRTSAQQELRIHLLAAAEISGACRAMVEMTREHLLIRKQFGQVLGANQALKHAIAGHHTNVEALSFAVDYAAAAVDAGSDDAEVAVCAAKHFANHVGKLVADGSLQLHGAIGYTMEYPLQLLMRRAYRLSATHGAGGEQARSLCSLFDRAASAVATT